MAAVYAYTFLFPVSAHGQLPQIHGPVVPCEDRFEDLFFDKWDLFGGSQDPDPAVMQLRLGLLCTVVTICRFTCPVTLMQHGVVLC